jgi:multidrug efflux system membrane fusion protein
MRIVPIILALVIAAALYFVVIERDRLIALVSNQSSTKTTIDSEAVTATDNTTAWAGVSDGVVRVMALRSQLREIDNAIILRGQTEAARQVIMQAETSGRIASEPLPRGAFVKAGQVLCEIDPGTRSATLAEARARLAEALARRPEVEARIPEAEARVREAAARLKEAEINANAATRLSADGFASESRVASADAALSSAKAAVISAEAGLKSATSGLDSLEASAESARAAVQRSELDIARLKVTAPFAGVLETDTAELGSLLNTQGGNALCATILQLDPIRVVGFVPETEVGRIEVGADGRARLTDGRTLSGQVSFVARSADPLTRTFRVELTVPNSDQSIRDGQTAEIMIAAEGVQAHLIPASSLTLNNDGTLGVRLVADDNTAQFTAVTFLRDTRDGAWITGLKDDARIITVGQEYVTDGVPVHAFYEAQETSQ